VTREQSTAITYNQNDIDLYMQQLSQFCLEMWRVLSVTDYHLITK